MSTHSPVIQVPGLPQEGSSNFVSKRHVEHKSHEEEWRTALAAYRGGPEWASSALLPFRNEADDNFEERQRRSYSRNFTRRIVKNRESFLFRKLPVVTAEKIPETMMADIDRRGNSVAEVMKIVARRSMITGTSLIVIDSPMVTGEALTQADAERLKLRPYWTIMSVLSAVNWGVDDQFGDLDWILFKLGPGKMQFDAESQSFRKVESPAFLFYDRQEWIYFTDKGRVAVNSEGLALRGFHGLAKHNTVPVVRVRFDESLDQDGNEEFVGRSLITDIVSLNREIINLSSAISQILNRQGFSLLAGDFSEMGEPTMGPDGKPGRREIKLEPSGLLQIPPNAIMPQFISPDASNAQVWLDLISSLIDESYLQAELQRGSASTPAATESGISRAFRFLNTNQALKEQFSTLSSDIRKALRMTGQMMGLDSKDSDFTVTGPEDFGVQGPGEALDQFKKLMEALASPAMGGNSVPHLILEGLNTIVDTAYAEMPDKKRAKLKKTIEEYLIGDRSLDVPPALLKEASSDDDEEG